MTTDELLSDLRASRADLARLIETVIRDRLPYIVIPTQAVQVWREEEPQRWAEVIGHAGKNYHVDLALTGGTSSLEQAHLAEIKSKLRHSVIDLSGKTDLLTLAALVAQARLLVTVDSAPMHLAAATRTPQVILFGPTNPFHWRPRESPALILQGGSTPPVTEFVSKQPGLPMNQISTQAVIDAMDSLLSAPAAQGL